MWPATRSRRPSRATGLGSGASRDSDHSARLFRDARIDGMSRVYITSLNRVYKKARAAAPTYTAVQMCIETWATSRHYLLTVCAHSPRRIFMACATSSLNLSITTGIDTVCSRSISWNSYYESTSYRQYQCLRASSTIRCVGPGHWSGMCVAVCVSRYVARLTWALRGFCDAVFTSREVGEKARRGGCRTRCPTADCGTRHSRLSTL